MYLYLAEVILDKAKAYCVFPSLPWDDIFWRGTALSALFHEKDNREGPWPTQDRKKQILVVSRI